MKNSVRKCLIVLLLLFVSNTVFAEPIKWYLKDVKIRDGSLYVFGSFVYDADSGTFSEVDITVTGLNPGFPGNHVTLPDLNPDLPGNSGFINVLRDASASTLVGQTFLSITLLEDMTNAGGTVDIVVDASQSFLGLCAEDDEGRECGTSSRTFPSNITAGSVTTIMPGPVTWYLQGVRMTDGGRAIGSFVFDSETGRFSDIDVITTAGSAIGSTTYGDPDPGSPGNSMYMRVVQDASAESLLGQEVLGMLFSRELLNTGGLIEIEVSDSSIEGECGPDSEGNQCGMVGVDREILRGYVSSVPIGTTINAGMNGAWYLPNFAGQGILIDVLPDIPLVFLAWFTYDVEGGGDGTTSVIGDAGHRWMTAQGIFRGNEAVLDVVLTKDGIFANDKEVENSPANSHGRIVLTFDRGCRFVAMDYDLFEQGKAGGMILQRLAEDNIALCLRLVDEQQQSGSNMNN